MRTGDPEEDETRFSNQSAFRCVSVLDRSSFTTRKPYQNGWALTTSLRHALQPGENLKRLRESSLSISQGSQTGGSVCRKVPANGFEQALHCVGLGEIPGVHVSGCDGGFLVS